MSHSFEYYYYYAAPSPLPPFSRDGNNARRRELKGGQEGGRERGDDAPGQVGRGERVHREGGGWRRRHKGRDRGEKGGWKRRMPVVPSPRYESANSLLPPGFSRYPLSLFLSLYFSFSLSLSSIQSIGSQPCLSVPRELPPHSASRESSSDQPRCLSTSLRCFNSKVCRSSKTASSTKSDRLFFSFDIIKATASRNVSRDTFLPFDNITFHVPAREKVRLVPRAPLFPERI